MTEIDYPVPVLIANYPAYKRGEVTLLPTPARTQSHPDYNGKGVTIAFIDSGFYQHPDLKGRIRVHVDATTYHMDESHTVMKSPAYSWHGQMTSVIACGDGSRSQGRYRGIASGADLVLVKISNPRNQIKEADILRGLRWVQANHLRYDIKVVNLSVGGDYVSYDSKHPLHAIIRALTDVGVLVVVAAGNSGGDHLLPPASAADALVVGGIDDQNTLTRTDWTLYHHNYGMAFDGSSKPDILAPARWIASPILPSTQVAMEAFWLGALMQADENHRVRQLIRDGNAEKGLARLFGEHPLDASLYELFQQRIFAHKLIDAHHQHVDGTSVAAPIVSAVAAQILEANPQLSPREIIALLRDSAQPLPNVPTPQQGAGVLNASEAVRRALALKTH